MWVEDFVAQENGLATARCGSQEFAVVQKIALDEESRWLRPPRSQVVVDFDIAGCGAKLAFFNSTA